MGDNSDLHTSDGADVPTWAQSREQRDHAQAQAHSRYLDHLTAVLTQCGVADPAELAETVLDALLVWRDVDSGTPCRCSCHPQLPDSSRHDYGFTCPCSQLGGERSRSWENWRNTIEAYWSSPEGQQIAAAEQAADAEFADWLTTQDSVTMSRLADFAPEQWTGEIDGHRFEFRERHGQWNIEIDQHPSGRYIQHVAGTDPDGTLVYREREIEEGEHIGSGTTADEGYGSTLIERARFIIDKIRTHLTRQTCRYHLDTMEHLDALLGAPARWCPLCGARRASP
ncbi:hypothetical protein [Mycolicibacterium sp. CBMA 226]|uniref:hypothetical protein n=1 Tax=Mycolicibacterium sp. CBMA 226 TaxID=2606611 RepID=UPI00130A8799|nr:hypothetical protein [Mycolicibacterium sp. CBMA 226]MUL78967.1 hypothetical protein [Mycolicibacterium sp. CBMA 226]QGW61278.1 hypothetical protein ICEMyc226_00246 [Mycolicibacterium sp.]